MKEGADLHLCLVRISETWANETKFWGVTNLLQLVKGPNQFQRHHMEWDLIKL